MRACGASIAMHSVDQSHNSCHREGIERQKRRRKEEGQYGPHASVVSPTTSSKTNTAGVALCSTVIDACFMGEFNRLALCFVVFFCPLFRPFGTLVLASSNPLAPIIISAPLITDNKETWRRCAVHNSRDFFSDTAGKDLFF